MIKQVINGHIKIKARLVAAGHLPVRAGGV
jgi:hypothetical protein